MTAPGRGVPALVRWLDQSKHRYGADLAAAKADALRRLATARIASARSLLAYHDALCFLQAWPDNREVRALADAGLAGFERRVVGRLRKQLADSGVAGTVIEYPFSYHAAAWLHRHGPRDAKINWGAFEHEDQLLAYLPWLVARPEHDALDDDQVDTRDWLMAGQSGQTDFAVLFGLFEQSRLPADVRDTVYELLAVPVAWRLRGDTACRTTAGQPTDRVHYQRAPLDRGKPDPRPVIRRPLRRVQRLSREAGAAAIGAGLAALAVRLRELYPLLHANPDDALAIDLDRGLRVILVGVRPAHRLPLETPYYFHVLKNGVPIGYGCITGLVDRAEVAANIFPEFRWGESAYLYTQLLRIAHHLLGARRFLVETYQIGEDNDEAIKAGVFWFYYKLGFRPTDPAIARRARAEEQKIRCRPGHRTAAAVLRALAGSTMMLDLGKDRAAAGIGFRPGQVGLAVTRYVAENFGGDRRAATRAALRQLRHWLPLGARSRWRPEEWQALENWSLVLVQIPGLADWPARARRDLVALVRAKGGTSELEYLRRLQQHRRLVRALAALATRAVRVDTATVLRATAAYGKRGQSVGVAS